MRKHSLACSPVSIHFHLDAHLLRTLPCFTHRIVIFFLDGQCNCQSNSKDQCGIKRDTVCTGLLHRRPGIRFCLKPRVHDCLQQCFTNSFSMKWSARAPEVTKSGLKMPFACGAVRKRSPKFKPNKKQIIEMKYRNI